MTLNNFKLCILCGFSSIHLLLSYIDRLYHNVCQKYWLWRTGFDAYTGVIINVNFAHAVHLHMFGVCRPQVLRYVSLFFTFTLGPFFSVLGFDCLRRSRKIAKRDCRLRYVCLSLLTKQLGFYWTDSHEIWYLSTFWKSVESSGFTETWHE